MERGCVEDQPQHTRKHWRFELSKNLSVRHLLRLVEETQPRSGKSGHYEPKQGLLWPVLESKTTPMFFCIPVKFVPLRARWPLLLAGLLAGCGPEEITTYRVPKERAPVRRVAEPSENSPRPQLRWKLPAGWEELPPSEIRVGNFQVSGADGAKAQITIIPLPGAAGRELDNVNRWRGQVGLGPVAQEELAGQSTPVEVGGQPARLYDLAGTPPEEKEKGRILAVIFQRGDLSWFFKMTGPDALVQQQKTAFTVFLKTISFEDGTEHAAEAGNVKPPADPGQPAWKVPGGWQEQPAGPMQSAKFTVPGNAEVSVSVFPGDVGGVPANVNRWRGQLGLPPADAAELLKIITPLDLGGVSATLVDMTNKPRRMVGVIVPRGGQTWFFKLLGDEAAVAGAKDALVEFVKSAK